MLSEIPSHPEKAIRALEIKLALAKGETPPERKYERLIAWYDQQSAIEMLNAMPRSFYCKLAARASVTITDHANSHGVPITAGSTISLPKVLQFFHGYLVEHGPKIRAGKLNKDRLTELAERKIEAELEQINTKIIALQLDNEKKRGTAVPIVEVREAWGWVAGEWRKFGERLGKKFGPDAQRATNEFLERLEVDAQSHLPGKEAASETDATAPHLVDTPEPATEAAE